MANPIKIENHRLVNKSAIARLVGLTPQYVGQLLRGEKKNQASLKKVHSIIQKYLQAA
jgi:DNA-binding transcriptional regulator YdaS (Cro superfamily)